MSGGESRALLGLGAAEGGEWGSALGGCPPSEAVSEEEGPVGLVPCSELEMGSEAGLGVVVRGSRVVPGTRVGVLSPVPSGQRPAAA